MTAVALAADEIASGCYVVNLPDVPLQVYPVVEMGAQIIAGPRCP